jgi:antitoxin component of RelBE/YafQ-DinJ toxin-antitoxin module
MSDTNLTHICAKIDKKTKELFLNLCEKEGIDISQGLRDLILEALSRSYIIEERKKRMEKVKEGGSA